MVILFTPGSYRTAVNADMENELNQLGEVLSSQGLDDAQGLLKDFSEKNNASIQLLDSEGTVLVFEESAAAVREVDSDDTTTVNMGINIDFNYEGQAYILSGMSNQSSVTQVNQALFKLLPYLLVLILVLAFLGAYLAYRFISKPVIELSKGSQRIADLQFDQRLTINQPDELGQLAGSMNQLAENLSTALEELKASNEQLTKEIEKEKERKQQQKDFFSAVSHELKTPITVIKCNLDGMIHQIGSYKDRDKYLLYTQEIVGSMETLVQEIMMISKLENRNIALQKKVINLSMITNSYVLMNEQLAETKSIQVSADIEEDCFIFADDSLLRKVISNVINNAVIHSNQEAAIKVTLKREAKGIVLKVVNTNTFIPEEDLAQLFDAFYRMDKSRSRHSGGSGLGLYIVKTILDKHGFPFSLENSQEGVCFTILFDSYSSEQLSQ